MLYYFCHFWLSFCHGQEPCESDRVLGLLSGQAPRYPPTLRYHRYIPTEYGNQKGIWVSYQALGKVPITKDSRVGWDSLSDKTSIRFFFFLFYFLFIFPPLRSTRFRPTLRRATKRIVSFLIIRSTEVTVRVAELAGFAGRLLTSIASIPQAPSPTPF